ncbi:MAG: 50S ribosomal protein L4 [Candidatus Peribacteraceae bacterium]|nr:50S ribosomal protein L4 [Candidatus Peribacteraceae bacterium]
MNIDLFTATGTKKGSLELPARLFEAKINKGLMHLALVRQLSNRRHSIAHVKHRGEVVGTTKKAFAQKHTGAARRGALRSPLLRGGGKSFGPRNESNFTKDMPKKMRRAALFSCLSLRAKEGAIIGLENYPDDTKTKNFMALLTKLPVEYGRRIVVVTAGRHRGLELSTRNIPRVKAIFAQYLNPEDILNAKHIIFLADAVNVAEQTFGGTESVTEKRTKKDEARAVAAKEKESTKVPTVKKEPKAKAAPKKKASTSTKAPADKAAKKAPKATT